MDNVYMCLARSIQQVPALLGSVEKYYFEKPEKL